MTLAGAGPKDRRLGTSLVADKQLHSQPVGAGSFVAGQPAQEGQLWIAMDFVDSSDAAKLLSERNSAGMPQELVVEISSGVGAPESGILTLPLGRALFYGCDQHVFN